MKQFVILAFVIIIGNAYGDEEVTELMVESIHKPAECSRAAARGDMLSMHYKGSLFTTGAVFDSSYNRGEPFKFQIGVGQVIKGWDDGLIGICPGEKRKLTIPSHLGYGDVGAGESIPPKSTLLFEVECIAVEDGPAPVNIFKEIDMNSDNQLSREELSDYLKKQVPEGAHNNEIPDQDKLVEDIFQHEDRDKNGYISHDEFSGPKHDEL
ncbi:Peptidyl-prolyl cis-trans isomerase fkbp14 [Blomia tropicalis]|nr:Peptidyl-prolyl cis-trans isomerase fkbp14 [Blomia tropicalis]